MDVWIVQAGLDMGPGITTIQAPEDSIDLDPSPYNAMVVRVDHHTRHKWGPDGALLGDIEC